MGRIRTIKPEFFRSSKLYQYEVASKLPLRIAFAGLWTACDRDGKFKWIEDELKLDCLPYDKVDFSRVLDALATCGYIVDYEIDGEKYGLIPSWHKHQVINNRESQSKLPDPTPESIVTREPRVGDALLKYLSGKERKGKEGELGKEGEMKIDFAPDLTILDPYWRVQFERWIEHRSKVGKPLDTQERIELQIKKLIRLSGGQLENAIEVIDQSIAENWEGLFAIKERTNGNQRTTKQPNVTDEDLRTIVRAARASANGELDIQY